MSFPAKTKSAAAVKNGFMQYAATQDKVEGLTATAQKLGKAAAEQLGWRVGASTRYRHTSIHVAERSNRRIIDGARALLHTSGLPHCLWGYACHCFCALRNVHGENRHSKSAYENRHGALVHGRLILLGSLVS